MSKWIAIIEEHRAKYSLSAWETFPESHYPIIAAKCGADEIAEIKQRLHALDKEEKDIPQWDGDTQDDIWRAREFFLAILKFAEKVEKP